MATYDSIHTGEQVDQAVDIVLNNKNKGSNVQPIYLDANGEAKNVNVDAAPTQDSQNLVQSGGVFSQLSTKYAKADISIDDELGTSNVLIPSQGAVKSYVDTKLATKQDVIVAGDGIVKDGNTLSISTNNDFMTVGKLDNKWSHFVSGLDMGYGTETIEKMENAKRSTFDLSKFEIVGSPTITEDGILSNCGIYALSHTAWNNKSNLKCNFDLTELSGKSWSISIPFNFNGSKNNQQVLIALSSDTAIYPDTYASIHVAASQIYWGLPTGQGTDTALNYRPNFILGSYFNNYLDEDLLLIFSFNINTGTYTMKFTLADGTTPQSIGNKWTQTFTPTTENKELKCINGQMASAYLRFAPGAGMTENMKGLKITVNGKEVFSGNKTGLDVIKPDNYVVVGNPTITDDGVASGFSADNALGTTQNISYNNSFKIIFPDFILSPYTHNEQNFVTVNNSNFLLKTWQSKDLSILLYDGTSTIVSSNVITNLAVNTLYSTKLIFENDTYKFYVKGGIYSDWTETWSYASSLKAIIGGFIGIGTRRDYPNTYFEGSIDLNSFKIYADGDLVYQPCLKIPYTQTKDGKKIVDYNYRSRVEDEYTQAGFTPYYTLDTESRGNYTVVGSPTISSDWIASGFSSSNKIYANPVQLSDYGSWELLSPIFTLPQSPSGNRVVLFWVKNTWYGVRIEVNNTSLIIRLTSSTSSDNDILYLASFSCQASTSYQVKIKFTGTEYIVYTKVVGNDWVEYGRVTSSTKIVSGLSYCYIGSRGDGGLEFTGSIDLKDFKVYVDGKEVYRAVTPPNYTMATVKESTIVDSYDNGINKWTKLANLTCKQQGSCTSGTAVTFTKPYIDTNYALSVPYTSGTKTKTGFTPSATGDWIANGKVDLNA